jgi:valyl-tRNA synthetase
MASTELPKNYDAVTTESRIYERWETSGFFDPENMIKAKLIPGDAKPFTVMMPPPNVTGVLHMGHALMLTVQDIMVRFARMRGRRTLWLPGTDHAAIATQAVVEKDIYKKEGKTRHDLGREELLSRIQTFAQASHDTIVSQVKVMGASCDWSREAFTLDEPRSRAVRTVFKQMYDDGLIYRGNRIVNWDPKGQTTISDDEIVHEERPATLWTFRYAKDFPIPVATTRPETKVGDVAVAVHPDDERYATYVGKEYDVVFCGVPLHITIVADQAVDPTFGTGAVGVTPAHSMTDWEIAQRHDLPAPQVINEYAKMTVEGPLKDQKVGAARETVVQWIRDQGLLEKEEPTTQNIATAERTGGIVEPLPKLQWFVNVNKDIPGRNATLKGIMREAVAGGKVKIIPEHFEKTYFHWIDNLRDWCISRQIWYGHRVPVWYCESGHITVADEAPAVCKQCSSKDSVVFGTPHPDAQPRSSIIAYVEDEDGKVLTINWGDALGGKLLVGGGLTAGEDPIECARREIAEETGFTDIEHLETLAQTVTNNYFAASKNVWRTITITALKFKLKSQKRTATKLEEDEQGKFAVEWTDIDTLRKEMRDPAHAYVLRSFAGIPHTLTQDPDTLDTWFSSGLWTFSTLGWPSSAKALEGKPDDLKIYHPTDVLETGYEILFFWVARMIMLTGYALDDIPFRTVYLHGTVRDAQGRKMSKSLGNGIDPIDVAKKFGADAGRMALVVGNTPGTDSRISEDKIKAYKHFANKLWNIARFVLMSVDEEVLRTTTTKPEAVTDADHAILKALDAATTSITKNLERFAIHEAANDAYQFTWHELADIYLEAAKTQLADDKLKGSTSLMLGWCLTITLKLVHPFAPFVTEELWSRMFGTDDRANLLMVQKWPTFAEATVGKPVVQ